MIYVGVDWSDKSHSFCVLDSEGRRLDAFQIPHAQAGFEKAHARIAKACSSLHDAAVAIETRDSLIVDFLSEVGYTLYFLNPRQTDRFRDRHRMSHSKSDYFDAFVLADALRTDPHLFNALSPLDEGSLKLRVLTRTRKSLVERKVAIQNELTSALKRYFPAALELFDRLDHPAAISFLLQYPTYDQACTVSQRQIEAILKNNKFSAKQAAERARGVRAKLREPQPKPTPAIASAYPLAGKSLLVELQSILDRLTDLDKEIAQVYNDHPNKDLIESLPGFGITLAPVIAAEVGADPMRFSSVKTLKPYAGTIPVTKKSGKCCRVHFRRACNMHLRRALHLAKPDSTQPVRVGTRALRPAQSHGKVAWSGA